METEDDLKRSIKEIINAFNVDEHWEGLTANRCQVSRRNCQSGRLYLYEDPFNCLLALKLAARRKKVALDGSTSWSHYRDCLKALGVKKLKRGRRPDLLIDEDVVLETKVLPYSNNNQDKPSKKTKEAI